MPNDVYKHLLYKHMQIYFLQQNKILLPLLGYKKQRTTWVYMHFKVYKIRRTEQIFCGSFKMCFLTSWGRQHVPVQVSGSGRLSGQMQWLIADVASGGWPLAGKAVLIVPNSSASAGYSCGHWYWLLLPSILSAAVTKMGCWGCFWGQILPTWPAACPGTCAVP